MCAHLNCHTETLPMSNTITKQLCKIEKRIFHWKKAAFYLGAIYSILPVFSKKKTPHVMSAHWNCLTEILPMSNIITIQMGKIEEKKVHWKKSSRYMFHIASFQQENMCDVCSLELPHWNTSNEQHNNNTNEYSQERKDFFIEKSSLSWGYKSQREYINHFGYILELPLGATKWEPKHL